MRAGLFVALLAGTLLLPGVALAHGDAVPVSELGSAWEPSPVVVGVAMLLLALFLQGWIRLRRRGRKDHAGVGRIFTFVAGLALGVLPLISPLDAVAEEYLLSAHMLEHVLMADAAVALCLLAVRGPLLFFLLPAPALSALARLTPLRRVLAFLTRPAVGFTIWCGVIAVWHIPALYDATLTNQALHDLEHATFVLAGFLVWYQLIDPAGRHELSHGQRLGLAAGMFGAGMILSSVLLFSGRALYPAYARQDERLLDITPLLDQRLAGAAMMMEQAIALGTFGVFLLLAADQEARAAGDESPSPAPAEPSA
jgi:cytochrome c oxidase assembly factor CtaG